jgi:hypothetical protein
MAGENREAANGVGAARLPRQTGIAVFRAKDDHADKPDAVPKQAQVTAGVFPNFREWRSF